MSDAPAELRIGLAFPFFLASEGSFSPYGDGMQTLASFLMAVREINDKTDGIADELLPYSQLVFAARNSRGLYNYALLSAIDLAQNAFGGEGVQGVIGPIVNEAVVAVQQVLGKSDVLQIGCSNANELNHPGTGLTYLTTRAIVAFEAEALALLVSRSWLRLSRVVVLHSSDAIGDGCFEAFANVAEALGIKIVAEGSFSSLATDLSSVISKVSVYRPRVIVLFSGSSASAARLLEQGFNSGLISSGVTVLVNSLVSSAATTDLFVNKSKTAAIMKGLIGLATYEDYWKETAIGRSFLDRFRAQPTRASIDPETGATICDESTDSDGGFYLYREHMQYNTSLPKVCAFVNFSTILPDGSNLIPFAPHVYDAVYAMARGFHEQFYETSAANRSLSGIKLKQTIVSNVQFEGVTGLVSFTPPTGDGEIPGGSRYTSVKYKVVSFHTARSSFGRIGLLDMDTKTYTPCTPSSSCFSPEFNTVDNAWPTDAPLPAILAMGIASRIAIYCIAALVLLTAATVTFLNAKHRNHRYVKAMQSVLSHAFVFGAVVGSGRVLVSAFDVSPTICAMESVLGHVSFFACISTIIVKKMRLDLLINSAGFKKVKSLETDGLKRIAVVLTILAVYLAIEGGLDTFAVSQRTSEDVAGRKSVSYQCEYTLIEFEIILTVLEGIAILYALYLCCLTRGVPDFLNDKHRSTAIIVFTVLVGVAVRTITDYLSLLRPEQGRLLSAIAFGSCLLVALAFQFGPHLYDVWKASCIVLVETSHNRTVNFKGVKLITLQNLRDLNAAPLEEKYNACLEQETQWKKKKTEIAAAGVVDDTRNGVVAYES